MEQTEAARRGAQWGAFFKAEGRDYSAPYPSNPYPASDPRCAEYAAAYAQAFEAA